MVSDLFATALDTNRINGEILKWLHLNIFTYYSDKFESCSLKMDDCTPSLISGITVPKFLGGA